MSEPLTLIVGLGNPGDDYRDTRHNAGFWFIDQLAQQYEGELRYQRKFDAEIGRIRVGGEELWLLKPMSFMNLSGGPLRAVLDYYRLSIKNTLVAHDELDLDAGTLRLKIAGGHGGHNGLRDIISHCGNEFYRLRVGIGHPGSSDKVLGHVLKRPNIADRERIEDALDRAVKAVPKMQRRGVGVVMNELNRKVKKPKPPKIEKPSKDEDAATGEIPAED